jgi:hypothetical protein
MSARTLVIFHQQSCHSFPVSLVSRDPQVGQLSADSALSKAAAFGVAYMDY